jgi:hypothetical protein
VYPPEGGRRRNIALFALARTSCSAWHRVPLGRPTCTPTAHLIAINRLARPNPWKASFSYGRALQDPALEVWHGRHENPAAGQQAFYHRARLNGAASVGTYTHEMEAASLSTAAPPHRRNWRDD